MINPIPSLSGLMVDKISMVIGQQIQVRGIQVVRRGRARVRWMQPYAMYAYSAPPGILRPRHEWMVYLGMLKYEASKLRYDDVQVPGESGW